MKEVSYKIIIKEEHFNRLREHLLGDVQTENAAYLLCGRSIHKNKTRLLVKDVVTLGAEDFSIQRGDRLQILPQAVARVMKRARLNNESIVLTHSHPFCNDEVNFSWADDLGESESFANFYQVVPEGPHASLVFGQRAVCGRVWLPGSKPVPLATIVVVGAGLEKIPATGRVGNGGSHYQESYDRQVKAFGSDGQRRIEEIIAAVVGAGGTGSIVAEQLVRLGVRKIIAIDNDHVELSNVSRIYNSSRQDAEENIPKVRVVERMAQEVGFDTEICSIEGNITNIETALSLREADVIFCCTDNQWSRAVLNQYSYQYLTPVIDMGNRIDSQDGRIIAANGRVYSITPNKPCLWCYGILNGKQIADESLPDDERDNLANEGYVRGTNIADPSVIFLNTVVAGLAVAEFVNLVTSYMGREHQPQLTYHAMTGEVKANVYEANSSCSCSSGKFTGAGDSERLPCR